MINKQINPKQNNSKGENHRPWETPEPCGGVKDRDKLKKEGDQKTRTKNQ
jgi:hypothetical protein